MPNLFRNASWGGASATVRLLFGMGNLFLAINLAGAVSYGYLTVMVSITTFYVALINSVHTIAVTHAAELQRQSDSAHGLDTLFSAVWLLTLVGAVILGSAAILFGQPFLHAFVYWGGDTLVENQLSQLLVFVVLIAICQILGAGHVAVIESLGRFDLAAKAQLFGPAVVFTLMAFGFYSLHKPNIVDVGKFMLVGGVVDLLLATWLRLKMKHLSSFKPSAKTIRLFPGLLNQGFALQGANLINIFFDPFNKFLLNRFIGPTSVSTYEIATKIVLGIRGLFGGACRTFLQLSSKLSVDGSSDYLKVLHYGLVPAVLMHGIGCVLMVLVSRYWFRGEMEYLPIFYFTLIPSSIGIIFAGPLYNALIGIRDLGFIFRMHLNLAVLNFIASLLLIPFWGLLGAGIGLSLTTAYNAWAEYHRYSRMIGVIVGFKQEIQRVAIRVTVSLSVSVIALLAGYFITDITGVLIVESVIAAIFLCWLMLEPLSIRIMRVSTGWLGHSS